MKGKNSQKRAPILEGIEEYHRTKLLPFTVPGHKHGKGIGEYAARALGKSTFKNDMQLLVGVDDRTGSKGYQEDAEELAAEAFGADKVFFSTNGTSLSVHAAIMVVTRPGDKIIVPRNAHRSLVAALVIAEVEPIFIEPEYDPDWDLVHGIDPEQLEAKLKAHPEAKAVYAVSPDYYGVTSDLKTLAMICHRYDRPLIVDEAWGPHFAFHPKFPPSAMKSGADLSMGSLHKTMTTLTQGGIVLIQGDRIDVDRFKECYYLFETTSPSGLIIGSIDSSRQQMVLNGKKLWDAALKRSMKAREALSRIDGIRVMGKEILGTPGRHDMDLTKIVLDVKGLGIPGFKAADWLWNEKQIGIELADHRRLMGLVTVADSDKNIAQFVAGIRDLAKWAKKRFRNTYVELPPENSLATECLIPPGKAYCGKKTAVKIDDAVNKIAAEMVSPYPPGIPRIYPGTRITQPIIDYLKLGQKAGMFQEDAADSSLKTLLVVDESEVNNKSS